MRSSGGADLRAQVSLDPARVSARLFHGRHAARVSHRRRGRRLVGTAQPPACYTGREPQPRGAVMKAPLVVLLLAGLAARAAAQDTTAKPAPAPAPAPAAAPSDVSVEAVLARSVADRAPQDTGTAFSDSVGTIVLWMRVTGAGGQTLHHVGFFGDTEVGNVPLAIGGSPWRTWSRKTIPADAKGAWHVEIRDEAGAVLKRIDFTVGQYNADLQRLGNRRTAGC